jgi:hypothetical protein
MSEFAFFRFKSNTMLNVEEEQQTDEIIRLNEEVLEAKGIERDPGLSKISEEQSREILEEDLARKGRKLVTYNKGSTMAKKGDEEGEPREEVQYIR